jgi:DNA-binding NtrC family response regulator
MSRAVQAGRQWWPYVVGDGTGEDPSMTEHRRPSVLGRASARPATLPQANEADPTRPSCLVGVSDAIQAIREDIARVASSQCDSVLVTGETGTGKEVVAREIHHKSHDSGAPFVAVSCPAIPDTLAESDLFGHVRGSFTGATGDRPGYFSLAHGGTLFLDEVGDLSPNAQAVLLRVLETRCFRPVGGSREVSVRVRVVAATNVELDGLSPSSRFRKDLFYRLNVFRIHLPPLRERVADILPLAEHFLAEIGSRGRCAAKRFSSASRAVLLRQSYPGNARELRALVERAAIRCDEAVIEPRHLGLGDGPNEASPPPVAKVPEQADESRQAQDPQRASLVEALDRARWNRRRAAADLGIPYSTFRYRLLRLGIR